MASSVLTFPVTTPTAIDASFGDGSGHIIRTAATLAVILKKPIAITHIRANRPKHGLTPQHLESLRALKHLSGAITDVELKEGLTDFQLYGEAAGDPEGGVDTTVDLAPTGSVCLCVQSLLPWLLTLQSPSRLRIIGGTHVPEAPNFDYLQKVWIPLLTQCMGYTDALSIQLKRPGYPPKGGGEVRLEVSRPLGVVGGFRGFPHFKLLERGRLVRQEAVLNITHKLEKDKAQGALLAAIESGGVGMGRRASFGGGAGGTVEVRVVPYASCEYYLEFEHSRTAFTYMADPQTPTTQQQLLEGIRQVSADYKAFMSGAAATDEKTQDQLIIYMALAKLADPSGSSIVRTGALTAHTRAAIHAAELLIGFKYKTIQEPPAISGGTSPETCLISI